MQESIPKIIHYCWFGKNEKPNIVKKCIETWRNILSDYQIIEWNEDSFDVNSNNFVREAYESGKFAFVSDYVRVYALYNYGGIYLDTDVEVYKPFSEDILSNEIMKLTIQPLVENYLVHGINMDSNNNVVIITIRKVEDYIEIEIKDNGVGIEDIKLNEIKEKLHKGEYNGNSIGLINVHERIRMYYGKKYGVSIEKGEIEGTKVTVKVPCKGVGDNV